MLFLWKRTQSNKENFGTKSCEHEFIQIQRPMLESDMRQLVTITAHHHPAAALIHVYTVLKCSSENWKIFCYLLLNDNMTLITKKIQITEWKMLKIPNINIQELTETFVILINYNVKTRVAPDMIFSNPAGAGFGIANPAGAGAECFLSCGPTWHKQQWNTRVNTKHQVNHQKFAIKLTSKVSDHRTLLLSWVMKWEKHCILEI